MLEGPPCVDDGVLDAGAAEALRPGTTCSSASSTEAVAFLQAPCVLLRCRAELKRESDPADVQTMMRALTRGARDGPR